MINEHLEKEIDNRIQMKRKAEAENKEQYIDILGMEKRVEQEREAEIEAHNKAVNEARERAQIKEELWLEKIIAGTAKGITLEKEKMRNKRIKEAEKQAEELVSEQLGLNSQKTLRINEAYKDLINNIPDMDD